MNLPLRRRPIALLLGCAFASLIIGGFPARVRAQTPAPLRVDPVLLGLPPIKPEEAPAPARPPVAAEKPQAEVKPVESAVVESRPVGGEPEPAKRASEPRQEKTAPPASPTVSPEAAPSPVAVPVPSPLAVPAPPRDDRQTVQPKAPVPQSSAPVEPAVRQPRAASAPVPAPTSSAASTGSRSVSSTAPLRVDPALLGLPPSAAVVTSAQPQAQPPFAPGAVSAAAATSASPSRVMVVANAPARKQADDGKSWYERLWAPIPNAYNKGSLELYLPFETYHLRSKYSQEKIATYQEKPKGFGVGRGLYNEKGDWEGVYAMGFQDSHFKPMYMAGYGWKSIWRPVEDVRVGLGYVAGLMSRTDIIHYKPFPIVLPTASIAYKNLSFDGAFVPGGRGWGNVAFFWAKWEFGRNDEPVGTPMKPEPPMQTEVVNTNFGASVPLARQRVPYGPAIDDGQAGVAGTGVAEAGVAGTGVAGTGITGTGITGTGIAGTGVAGAGVAGAGVAGAAGTGASGTSPFMGIAPPQVASTGERDEEEVPDVPPPLALRSSKKMVTPPKDSAVPRPVFLSAHRMGGQVDREFNAEGEAELRKIGTVLNSDQMTYWPVDDEVEAEGNVRLQQEEDVVTGPKMRLKLQEQVGYFDQPSYLLKRQPKPGSKAALERKFADQFLEKQGGNDWMTGFALPIVYDPNLLNSSKIAQTNADGRGEADRIDFEGENQFRLTNATFTTCKPGDTDWYAKTADLQLDYDNGIGKGKDGTVYFKDIPILYSPWLSFSLNRSRKSGFLAPSFGATSDSGLAFRLPYYWNIAPNMDATVTPRLLTKRGVMMSSEFRYLDSAFGGLYSGELRAEVLPDDKLREGNNRYGVSLMHRQVTSNGFFGMINYNKVSDGNYFTDLTSSVVTTSQTQLLQQGVLSYYGGGWWNAITNFQSYQTLQPDPKNPVLEQYRMLPQITVNARRPDLSLADGSFVGQYTAFTKPQQVINGVATNDPNGQRLVLYPQLALPYVTPGWYVTPKFGVNMRSYSLSGQAQGTPSSINTTLPIFSTDAGMTFERTSNWFGRDYTQTLEPRLYYLNIPYRNQDKIPLFDTGLTDFNFAQIFAENQYSSWDRVNNANQLTAAATTRLLQPNSGVEIMRAMIGQRFYFSRNQVSLVSNPTPLTDDRKWDKSDFLTAFSGQVFPRAYADLATQYSIADKQLKRYSVGLRYLPEPGKVLNAAYRYNSDESAPINQVDVSAQWPLMGRWYGVGRLNYSFKDTGNTLSTNSQNGRMIQSLLGMEYNGGCWVVRGVIQRLALTADSTSTGFFFQLELNDFASIGANPINILRRNIQGYGLINQPAADSIYGQ